MTSSLLVTVREAQEGLIQDCEAFARALRNDNGKHEYEAAWFDRCKSVLSALADALEASEKEQWDLIRKGQWWERQAEELLARIAALNASVLEAHAAGFAQCREKAVQLVQDRGEIYLGEAIRDLEPTP